MESPNTQALGARWDELGSPRADLVRAFRSFNAWAPTFRGASDAYERK